MLVAGAFFFVAVILFAKTLLVPSLFTIPPSVQQLKFRLKVLQRKEHLAKQMVAMPEWLNFVKNPLNAPMVGSSRPTAAPLSRELGPGLPVEREVRLGFYEGWDPASLDSLKANGDKLTHLCPDWLALTDGLGRVQGEKDQAVLDLVADKGLKLLPLLKNMGKAGVWIPEAVEGLINGPAARQDQFVDGLKAQLAEFNASGVVINWEQVDPSYKPAMSSFLTRLASSLHDDSLELWLCVPMGSDLNAFDLDALAPQVDRFVALLHDENAEGDTPGPIASMDWVNGWLDTLVDEYGDPSQWVISLGAYGYDWADGETEAATISFQDAMSRAGRASLATCEFDELSYNPHFSYEDTGVGHTVWFLDAVSFVNQLMVSRLHQVGGVAISRLGTEDPGIWKALQLDTARPFAHKEVAVLEPLPAGEEIAHIGKGNFITMADEKADGARRLKINDMADPAPLVTEEYVRFPSYVTVIHQEVHRDDAVAITFDDGPDGEWTPQILDILLAKGVKAAFFVVGANVERHPEIVERVVREGHMVGVHTYAHPNVASVSKERASLEFNASQRLIEAVTKRSTLLFRPPYSADTNPHEPEELVPIKLAQQLGYITVTEDIDTEDWDLPGVTSMVARVREGRRQGGTVVLMHDAGGDRSQTVAALPLIIDYLQARGDTILSLTDMIGTPYDQLMPPVPAGTQPLVMVVSGWGFAIMHAVAEFFWAFMLVATSLVVLRTLVIAWLAVSNRRHDGARVTEADCNTPVSVLIAAYNEGKVIRETLLSVLATSYRGELEVLVVDDGSQDDTAEIVTAMANADARIRLIRQANQGKATALQTGFAAVSHDIVVTLDADTQFEAGTIVELIRPFSDPAVGAVSGRARVGNTRTLVARFQSLEYTCGFNLDRRAYHQLQCITVVPGAVSAQRKSAVMAAGGICKDTLAEDTDLTLSLHRCGFRICYAPKAVAWTEAPETVRSFAKQRFRWAFGTLQCLWKHRDLLFDARYKALAWFSLPSAWFFNIFLVAIGPGIDALLLLSLVLSPANQVLYFYFLVFLGADLVLAAVACRIEREPLSQVLLVVPMRFVYRPVLSFSVAKAIVRAIKGVWVGWGKLDRTASVSWPAPRKG